jgi:hypothetical protein
VKAPDCVNVVTTLSPLIETARDRGNGVLGADTTCRDRLPEGEAEAGEVGGSIEPVIAIL